MRDYHDREWGVPLRDDLRLFEFLVLEGFQAGLSWEIILNKRENFRKAFDGFDFARVARYDERKISALLEDSGIIRNRAKIKSAVSNARAFLKVRNEFGSFDAFIWGPVGGKPGKNRWKKLRQIPAITPESEFMSKELKKRGFTFVGPTVCYAFMQAVGMVNDHLIGCFRFSEINR
jgi:DNA-3-methyladenine glycosylase I